MRAAAGELGWSMQEQNVCVSYVRIALDNGLQEGGKRLTTINNKMTAVLENKAAYEERNSGPRVN